MDDCIQKLGSEYACNLYYSQFYVRFIMGIVTFWIGVTIAGVYKMVYLAYRYRRYKRYELQLLRKQASQENQHH